MMKPPRVLIIALAAAATGLLAAPALAAKDDLILISRASGPAGAPVDGDAGRSSISAGGGQVAFDTEANNLSAEDNDALANIFVRDASTDVTTLVSRATGVAGAAADGNSFGPAISADGRFVAFESAADNLSADDDNGFQNIFVRDLAANTTTLVSRASGAGGAGANGTSTAPDISVDGRYVVFQSAADNLSAADNNAFTNIFVRDLVANTTTLVSRRAGPNGAGANDNSRSPTISGEGGRIAFDSDANNLSTEDDNGPANVFVRDLAAATNTLVSRATGPAGVGGNADSGTADISPSGRFVAFGSDANNLSGDDDNAVGNIFLRDLDESSTALASRASGPGGAGADSSSSFPVVSDNGRVAFQSLANNLSAADNDAVPNVFVRDALADTTELVSRAAGPGGVAANQSSVAPATSGDGRYVTFQSFATNLVAGAGGGPFNVYRRDVLGDAPVATPACKVLPLPPSPGDEEATFTLSVQQLTINQRISQAAIRRLNAVEARLNDGLASPRPVRLLGRADRARARHHQRPGGGLAGAGVAGRPGADRGPRPLGPGRPPGPERRAAPDQPAHRPGGHPPGDGHHQPPERRAHRRRRQGRPGDPGQALRPPADPHQGPHHRAPGQPDRDPRPPHAGRPRQRHPQRGPAAHQPAHRPGGRAQRQRPHPAPGDRPVGRRPAPGHPDGRRPGLRACAGRPFCLWQSPPPATSLLAVPALAAVDDLLLISAPPGRPGRRLNANATTPSISASGAQLAFDSEADNLSIDDDNGTSNVFVRDAARDPAEHRHHQPPRGRADRRRCQGGPGDPGQAL